MIMKNVYLIAVHHQPEMLCTLINQLYDKNTWFFIHVDKKVSTEPFIKLLINYSRVVFLDDSQRVKVTWGGFSQVQSTLNLLTSARKYPVSFNRYTLLSGADFPIKNNDIIQQYFQEKRQYIELAEKIKENTPRLLNRIQYYWLKDTVLAGTWFDGLFKRKILDNLVFYKGTNWWSLTDDCVIYILNWLENNPEYIRFFKPVYCADEIFFQTIIGNSAFMNQVKPLEGGMRVNVHACHFIDWVNNKAKSPRLLNHKDYDILLDSGALFARKFDWQYSRKLINMLVKHLLYKEQNKPSC